MIINDALAAAFLRGVRAGEDRENRAWVTYERTGRWPTEKPMVNPYDGSKIAAEAGTLPSPPVPIRGTGQAPTPA